MKATQSDHYVLSVKLRSDKISSFEAYPFCLPVVHHLQELELHPAVTFVVGENGSGTDFSYASKVCSDHFGCSRSHKVPYRS